MHFFMCISSYMERNTATCSEDKWIAYIYLSGPFSLSLMPNNALRLFS